MPGELQTFEEWPHRLHVFPLTNPSAVLFSANRFYGSHGPLQLLWDDLRGSFPWEPGYDPPGWLQPLPETFTA